MQQTVLAANEGLVPEKEIAEYLGLSLRSIINHRNEGLLPFYRIGRSIRYRKSEVNAALERRKTGGAS